MRMFCQDNCNPVFPSINMPQMFRQFPLAFFGVFSLMMLSGHAQDQADFTSIDCGLQQNSDYTESTTTIRYTPDNDFIDTGESRTVLRDPGLQQQFWFVRIFPEGTRNCYKINIRRGQKYLIRASFLYGNYDGENSLPEFELHLGASFWDTVVFTSVTSVTVKELIHITMRNYMHVCLVDIGKGVPLISTIELRRLSNQSYQTEGESLALLQRSNMAANKTEYRYPEDVKDRIWKPQFSAGWEELYSPDTLVMDQSAYQLPSVVMSTAATPASTLNAYLTFSWVPVVVFDKNASIYIYMHFAELEEFRSPWSRQLTITINKELIYRPFNPVYLSTTTVNTTIAAGGGQYDFSVYSSGQANYRGMLNAYEVYMGKEFIESETNQQDVEAITNLKSTYNIVKNWQGDPCNPHIYLWEGVNCTYSDNDSARIISLDLSSSGLTGDIADAIANLTMIETLDLSDNKLSGQIPEYLSQLPKLKILNLENNELTGSVPAELIARRNDNLSLSLCGNPSLLGQVPCEKKKNKFVVPVVASIIVMLLVSSTVAAILWNSKRFRAKFEYWRLGKDATAEEIEQNRQGHDAFLSFRGEDTREGFARNLHDALDKKGIKTYFDDQNLQKGDEIAPALFGAIEASKISIILFSENYVTSSWCLDELVQILDCKKRKNQRVVPIFYKVDPSNIRHQSGSFSLTKWIDKNDGKVLAWKQALEEVANLSGHHYKGGYEVSMIKKIVKHMSEVMEEMTKNSLRRFETIRPPDGEDEVVIYMTSLARDSNLQNCQSMIKSLSRFDLKVQMRDVSIRKFKKELEKLLMKRKLPPPRLFVNGKYVGGYDEVSKLLNEEPWFSETLKKLQRSKEASLHTPDVAQQVEAKPVSVSETPSASHGGSPA